MPYSVGEKGSYGCSGYPAVKEDGTVMGCHETREEAEAQIYAINQSEGNLESGVGIRNPDAWPVTRMKTDSGMGPILPASNRSSVFKEPKKKPRRRIGGIGGNSSGSIATTGGGTGMGTKEYSVETANSIMEEIGKERPQISEGDFVMGPTVDGTVYGRVEHIMWEGGTLGQPGEPYSMESMPPENPAMSVRVFEENEDRWVPTPYSIGMMYQDAQLVDMENMTMEQENEMEAMSKAETYSPNDGMKAAARRALKWKEDGEATGAGTPVGWGRARDIVAGRSMSLSVVRRMFSFFSRHEVDKQAEGFNSGEEGYPSNGRIMWDAWGGDAGFSWSRAIVERNKDKALFSDVFGLSNISKAKQEYYEKRERTIETRRRLAESGQAMPDGSYPIVTIQDLRNAIQAFGRASNPAATKEHIMRRARALGRTDLIPDNWTGEKFWNIRDITKAENFVVKADSVRVGQMVSWNSSGGRARGKVTRIIRSGSYNVPNSDFVINGTEENPAVVITLYRDGKPTDTTVAHRMSTLRAL